jgi:hypothetical protein
MEDFSMKQQYSVLRGAGFCLAALLLSIVFGSPLLAQLDISAQLVGTVTDPSGAVVPAAQLDARNQLTGVEIKTTANDSGNFLFPSLPVGTYTVTCDLAGFQTFITSGIVLQAGGIVTLRITLKVGTSKQTIEVSAAANMVNTVAATIQTTFDERILDAIPIWGRDPREAMELLMPGAVAAGTAASYYVPVTSFNGMSGLANNYRIDGSDSNDYQHGSASPYPPMEDLSEFSVTTNVSDASTGRGAGGQIEAVLKSGTNDLHGQVWGYFQNGAWNANSWQNNWEGIPKNHLSQQWWGGSVGGPVYIPKLYNGKGKTFFFTSYEHTSTSGTSTSAGQTITNEEREGNFTNSPDGIPVINGVPTPVIDPTSFTTMGKFLAAHTDVLPGPTNGVDTYVWNPSRTEVVQSFAGKIDHNFSEKHRLFGSLWWYRDVPTFDDMYYSFGQASWGTQYPNPKATWGEPVKLQDWTINDTYTISPTTLNNVIVGVKRLAISMTNTYNPSNALFNAADLGIGAVGDVNSPDVQQVSFPRAMGMGLWNGYVNPMTQNSYYIADNFTTIRGRHTLKAGMEFRNYHIVMYQTWGSGAGISFSDSNVNVGGTGNGIADMLLGLAPNFYQNNTEGNNLGYPAREAYLQDTFKVSQRLTFMYGARWEPYLGVHSIPGAFVTFRPGQASTEFPTAPVGIVTPGDRGIPPNLSGVKWGDVGPRASVAWDIFGNGRAAFRAGYALMPTYQVLLGFNEYTTTAPFGVSYSPNPAAEDLAHPYAQYGSVPFPWKNPVAGDPNNTKIVFPIPVNTKGKDLNYNNAMVHQWNFTFEFEPFRTYLLSVGYVATRGTHLNEDYDMNYPRFVPGASTNDFANVMSRRPWGPAIQTIDQSFADVNSLYNSLQVRFTKRYSYGLSFMGNYTLSSNEQVQNGPRYRGDAALDYYSPGIMHNFAVVFSYDLPIPTGKARLSKAFLGGWKIGGNTMGSSGSYGSVSDYNCAEFNYGSAGCNATFVGGSPYNPSKGQPQVMSGTQVGVSWLDPSKFIRADQRSVDGVATTSSDVGQRLFLGNAITGVFKGPAAFMLNASLSKTFAFTERFKLNYRIEAQNVLNHTVLNMPANTTVGPDMTHFGAINSAWNPRMIQMSARFIF